MRAAAQGLTGLPAVRTGAQTGPRRRRGAGPGELEVLRGSLAARDVSRSRRRRIAAAVAAAGLLITGVGLAGGERRPGLPELAGPDRGVVVDPQAGWEVRAEVTLAALHDQLEVIAETEAVWSDQIAEQYAGAPTPQAVVDMLAAKEQLLREVAVLEAQLGTAERLEQVREQAGATEVQLAALDAALGPDAAANPGGPLGPPAESADTPATGEPATGEPDGNEPADPTAEALRRQRELLAQSLAAQRAEERRLQRGVEAAREMPLPDPVDAATPLAQDVLDLDRTGDPAPGSPSTSAPPVIAQGREPDLGPPPQITTSGPDDPGEDDTPTPPPSTAGPAGAPGGPGEGDPRDRGPRDRDPGARDRDDRGQPPGDRGVVGEVADTAGDTVDALADTVGLGGDRDDRGGRDGRGEGGPGGGSDDPPADRAQRDEREGPQRRGEPERPERDGVVGEVADTAGDTVDALADTALVDTALVDTALVDTVGLGEDSAGRGEPDRGGDREDRSEERDGGEQGRGGPRADPVPGESEQGGSEQGGSDVGGLELRAAPAVLDLLDEAATGGDRAGADEPTGSEQRGIAEPVARAPRPSAAQDRFEVDRDGDDPPASTSGDRVAEDTEPAERAVGNGSGAGGDREEQLRVAAEVLDAVMPAVADLLDPALAAAGQTYTDADGDTREYSSDPAPSSATEPSGESQDSAAEAATDQPGSGSNDGDRGDNDGDGDRGETGAGEESYPEQDSADDGFAEDDSADTDSADADSSEQDSDDGDAGEQDEDGDDPDGEDSDETGPSDQDYPEAGSSEAGSSDDDSSEEGWSSGEDDTASGEDGEDEVGVSWSSGGEG